MGNNVGRYEEETQAESSESRQSESISCSSKFQALFTRKPSLVLLGEEEEEKEETSSSCYWRNEEESKSPLRRSSSSWLSLGYDEYEYTNEELQLSEDATHASDLMRVRPIWIVTTASLPWFTGTAVNPLLRAAYLAQRHKQQQQVFSHPTVTLVVPWLESANDRIALYGIDWQNKTQQDQENYIRTWLRDKAGLPEQADPVTGIQIHFYPARYHAGLSSIFAMGDFCEKLPATRDAVCVLEEPEHLSFYKAPGKLSWRQRFPHVIGIIHTNYKAYASHHYSGLVTGPLVGALSAWFVRAYCDKVIKLSDVLQDYAPEKEISCNVHGIRQEFLQVPPPTDNKVYFIGKLLWAKGLDKMLELEACYKRETGNYFCLDIYGSGPEEKEIQRAFLGKTDDSEAVTSRSTYYSWIVRRQKLPVQFLGRTDHASLSSDYKIFVNPSITEVLCTTTAEAIAMNKFVIIPNHPSNTFFQQFPNCLQYNSKMEFVAFLQYALSHDPEPLSDDLRHMLTWEAATDRFLESACMSQRDAARRDRIGKKGDERIANLHYELFKGHTGDVLRKVLGGGPVADQFKYEQTSHPSVRDVHATVMRCHSVL